jgi:hypothetical protein
MKHPEELLAAYVDGALGERERAEVDAHLAACDECREEVGLAGRARSALAALPDLEVPANTVRPGIERTGPKWQRDRFRRTAWATGVAAAAGIAAILALVLVHTPSHSGRVSAERQPHPFALPSGIVKSNRSYDAHAISVLAAGLADRVSRSGVLHESSAAVTAGGAAVPSPAEAAQGGSTSGTSKFAANNVSDSPRACVRRGAGLGGVRLLQVIEARYGETPAYIGVFLQDGALPSSVVVSVVARSACTLLTVVEHPLP